VEGQRRVSAILLREFPDLHFSHDPNLLANRRQACFDRACRMAKSSETEGDTWRETTLPIF
jgi:hypothetical protein